MRTLKQIEASRINGAKSRGPVTPEGKNVSARNSTTHGLCSRDVVLTNEDPAAWESVQTSFLQHWTPSDDMEILLVEEMAACHWKLIRAESMETALLNMEMDILAPEIERTFKKIDEQSRQAISIKSLVDNSAVLAQLDRQQARLSRQFDRAWKRLDQLRKDRPAPVIAPEPAIVQNEPEPQPPVESSQNASVQNEPKPEPPAAAPPAILQNEPKPQPATDEPSILDRLLSGPKLILNRS